MEKIQYNVVERDTKNASGKAKADVGKVLCDYGFKNLYSPLKNRYLRVVQQFMSIAMLRRDTFLFVQYPANIHQCYEYLKKKRMYKVCIIHDLESLRGTKTVKQEMSVLNSFDVVISHNPQMTAYLRSEGITVRIENLEIFDYLLPADISVKYSYFKHQVAFAGNLSKSVFLSKLGELPLVRFNLYGMPVSHMDNIICNANISYKGSFPSDKLIENIVGGWGLVWDGDSLDTCNGINGEYMKFNCPHKVSMYIAAERPIIIWEKAAMASYIVNHNLGITIGSLRQLLQAIDAVSEVQFKLMLEAVRCEKSRLVVGDHLLNVLKRIELE